MQNKSNLIVIFMTALTLLAALALLHPQAARALPEYSAQTGEPCATCHISPSGGGPRGPRGQAWVGGGKPGAVPDLTQALELLGIHMDVDESQYLAPAEPPAEAEALQAAPSGDPAVGTQLHKLMQSYDGN